MPGRRRLGERDDARKVRRSRSAPDEEPAHGNQDPLGAPGRPSQALGGRRELVAPHQRAEPGGEEARGHTRDGAGTVPVCKCAKARREGVLAENGRRGDEVELRGAESERRLEVGGEEWKDERRCGEAVV